MMEVSQVEVAHGRFFCIGFMTIRGEPRRQRRRSRPRAALVTQSGRRFPIAKPAISIGRRDPIQGISPDVDLSTEEGAQYVSRRHARLLRHQGRWVLVAEQGARNGTYVNGEPVAPGEGTLLQHGDHIRLGRVQAVLRLARS